MFSFIIKFNVAPTWLYSCYLCLVNALVICIVSKEAPTGREGETSRWSSRRCHSYAVLSVRRSDAIASRLNTQTIVGATEVEPLNNEGCACPDFVGEVQ